MKLNAQERLVGNLMGLRKGPDGTVQAHGVKGFKWGQVRPSQDKLEDIEE